MAGDQKPKNDKWWSGGKLVFSRRLDRKAQLGLLAMQDQEGNGKDGEIAVINQGTGDNKIETTVSV